MPRPRRSHLFELDATVLSTFAALVRTRGERLGRSYGLELASMLGRERSTVDKSLHRLVDLGLLVDEWDAGALLPPHGVRSVVCTARPGSRLRADGRASSCEPS